MKAGSSKNKGGRPTKYKGEYDELAYKFCLLGATDADLARNFGVSESRINQWKKDHPGFRESIKRGKEIADAEVAERLFRRAKGFEHDSEEIKVVDGEIVRVQTRKIYPPDTTAGIFWLKNRQKASWRDKTEQEVSGTIVHEGIEELNEVIRAMGEKYGFGR